MNGSNKINNFLKIKYKNKLVEDMMGLVMSRVREDITTAIN